MEKQHWQDWVSTIVGIWLVVSPFVLSFLFADAVPAGAASVNFTISGVLIGAMGIAALMAFKIWEEVSDVVVAVWLIISPWIIGFAGSPVALWNAVLCGLLVIAAAGWVIVDDQQKV